MIAALRRHPVLLGAMLLFAVLSFAYTFSVDMRATRGASITGDEPFYLMTARSLIDDGNLDLTAQYARESYRDFFDHPDGLWRQSVETRDGLLLSPHEPGLSVLVIPGFLLDSTRGVQVQLMLFSALTFALAYVFVSRETSMPLLSWLVTAAVGLSATAFVYATEIYPEMPAALCLVSMLLVLQSGNRSALSGAAMAVLVTLLMWLGIKYAPLGAIVALGYLWQAERPGRLTFVLLSLASGAAYVGFHYAVFEDLTAYSVNTVYEGAAAGSVLQDHVSLTDRAYRLWALFVDQRFGIARWAPLFLLLPMSLPLLLRDDGGQGLSARRMVLGLILAQVLVATFVAITMMGWWFPGRTLTAVLPMFALPLTLLLARLPVTGRVIAVALAALSIAFTLALRNATATQSPVSPGEVTLAVDPFDMAFWPFRQAAHLFPNYQSWSEATVILTFVWVALFLGSMGYVAFREYGIPARIRRLRFAPAGHSRLRRA
jgi:hypothetical protein